MKRRSLLPEALQLRMFRVSFRLFCKHCLREQCFAPERHKPARVKVARVKGPQSHKSKMKEGGINAFPLAQPCLSRSKAACSAMYLSSLSLSAPCPIFAVSYCMDATS